MQEHRVQALLFKNLLFSEKDTDKEHNTMKTTHTTRKDTKYREEGRDHIHLILVWAVRRLLGRANSLAAVRWSDRICLYSCRSSERGKDHTLQRKHYMLLGSESGGCFTDTENKPMVTKGEREGEG